MNPIKQLFKGQNSAVAAKQRLRLVLIHDRTEIPPGMLDLIKDDIVSIISQRVPIDRVNVSVQVDSTGNEDRLLIDIPLLAEERHKSSSARRRVS
jgi:cell division topological specificity factor